MNKGARGAAAIKRLSNGTSKKRKRIGDDTLNKRVNRYRTFDECIEEHLRENPEEIPVFLEIALEEYEKDRDEAALLMALRHAAKAKGGMTELAKKTDFPRESLSKTLSPTGNPRLRNLQRILETCGYSLTFKPLKSAR